MLDYPQFPVKTLKLTHLPRQYCGEERNVGRCAAQRRSRLHLRAAAQHQFHLRKPDIRQEVRGSRQEHVTLHDAAGGGVCAVWCPCSPGAAG